MTLFIELAAIRQFLEPLWQELQREWGGEEGACPSLYMCRHAALFLVAVLPGAEIEAGRGDGAGFLDANGQWQDHAWVRQGEWLLDITADQFGAAPVIVTAPHDPRYRANLSQAEITTQFSRLKPRWREWERMWNERKEI
jgi:hypothetical protein